MSTKIGVGVVTYQRPEYFKKCINSIPNVDTLIVVNDGAPYSSDLYPSNVKEVIQHKENKCVGISKNEILKYLIDDGCDYLFLVEDDMEILRTDVFEAYIKAAEASGIWHLNYGPGSPFNRVQNPELLKKDLDGRHLLDNHAPVNPRMVVEYKDGSKIALYQHSVGMFSFFHKGVIKEVGMHDERLKNAWEHIQLTYKIIKKGLHPPFWWFADLWDSTQYLREIEGAIENSSIACDKIKWKENVTKGAEIYKQIHGHYPAQAPDTSPEDVQNILKIIHKNYSKAK